MEWLKKELEKHKPSSPLGLDWVRFDKLYKQAKIMEREQIKDAWAVGVISSNTRTSGQYYNDTYDTTR